MTADKTEHCYALMEIKWAPSSRRLVLERQKLDDSRGCTYGVSSGKSKLLSSLALKVGEQVRLHKQGGGELPQQFSAKPGEAVKEGEGKRERERVQQKGENRNRWRDAGNLHIQSFKSGAIHSQAFNPSSHLNDIITARSH